MCHHASLAIKIRSLQNKRQTEKKIGRTYVTFFMYCKPNMEHTGGYCSHLNNFQLYSPMNQFLPSSHLPPSTDEPKLWNLISLSFTHKSPVFLLSNKPHNAVYYISLSRSCLYVTIIIYVMGRCLTGTLACISPLSVRVWIRYLWLRFRYYC